MASRKEYEMLFQLNAQLGNQFSGAFKKAQAEIASMQKELQTLNKVQGDITAYQKQQTALSNTQRKLDVLQQEYDNIQREMQETGNSSAALKNSLLNKQLQIEKTTEAVRTYEREIAQMGDALRAAGINTEDLAQESQRLASEIDGVKTRQQGVIDGFNEGGHRARFFGEESVSAVESIQQTLIAAGVAKLIKEIGEAMVDCAEESISFESAITGVYKTVDGTEQQLASINDEIKDMATEIPATTEEISAVAEAAGQLGVATEYVTTFTGVMIDLGESTNLSAEEAASSLAKFANITGTAATEYSRMGSTIVDLGNNFATTEADIVAMSTRLASAGTLAGLSEPEIMGLAAAMSSVGIEAEAGGTAMTQTLNAIEKAVVKGGDDLQEFGRIAGMSAEEFASTWKSSPIDAIQAFITGIGKLDQSGESAVLVLDELGLTGIRQSNMLKSLGLAAESLGGAVNTANNAWAEDIALSNEANKRYATTESKLKMLGNAYSNLQVAIGDVYTPAVRNAADIGIEMLGGITEFVEEHPAMVKAVTALGVGLGTFTVVLGGVALAGNVATKAMAALQVVMTANSWLLPVAAIGGVVTAVATLAITAEDEAVPSVRELTEAAREMSEVMEESQETHSDTVDSTLAAASVADIYIGKLKAMEAAGVDTDEEQKEYHNTLTLLCQVVPELSSYIDLETNSINGGTAALEANTEAWKQNAIQQAHQQYLTELAAAHSDVLIEQKENEIRLTEAETKRTDAENRQAEIQQRMNVLWDEAAAKMEACDVTTASVAGITGFLSQEYYDLQEELNEVINTYFEADHAAQTYQQAIDEGAEAVAAAKAEIDLAAEAIERCSSAEEENLGLTEDEAAQYQNLQGVLAGVNAEVIALADAYTEAYTAAQESVSGQYALWDQVAPVVETSASTINSALQSQITYWQDYNSNLQLLSERGASIEGLGEMLATFADGSEESAAAIAGMAGATDTELRLMVESWQALKEEQDLVAGGIAGVQTGFDEAMTEIETRTREAVEKMELSEAAANAGEMTVQGFINSAINMTPQVYEAYAILGAKAVEAIKAQVKTASPSKVTTWIGEMTVEGFKQPAEKMEGEVAEAYANLGHAGTTALAEEVQVVAVAPQLMAAQVPTLATPVAGGGISIALQIDNHFSSPPGEDLTNQLDQSAIAIRDLVRQTMEDVLDDRNRGAYR